MYDAALINHLIDPGYSDTLKCNTRSSLLIRKIYFYLDLLFA